MMYKVIVIYFQFLPTKDQEECHSPGWAWSFLTLNEVVPPAIIVCIIPCEEVGIFVSDSLLANDSPSVLMYLPSFPLRNLCQP